VLIGGALCVLMVVMAPAGSAQTATRKVSLGSLMTGEGGAVVATATAAPSQQTWNFTIAVTVRNSTSEPVDVEIPYGTLFAPADDAQQTVVTAGPVSAEAASIARSGATPTVLAPPGESEHELVAYCGQKLNSSAAYAVPVSYKGVAKDPLPAVMRNIAEQQPDPIAAQEAVWWVTDDPTLPVGDPDVEALLEGVDTASFAASPSKVVAQESYTPKWAGGGSGVRSLLTPLVVILVLVLLATGFVLVVARGRGRTAPALAATPTGGTGPVPGWYRDPAGSPHLRYWDGRGWTDRLR
jgi:hypothetical protein